MRRRKPVWCLVFALLFLSTICAAGAHPLGNFTINRLVAITPQAGGLRVRFVLDVAEIPAFQIMRATSADGRWSRAQLDRWASSETPVVMRGLAIEIDERPAQMHALHAQARERPGAGGLPTLYWVGDFTVSSGPGTHRIAVRDGVYADRLGWNDVVVAPATEPTGELLHYPSALVGSPRNIGGVHFDLAADGVATHVVSEFGRSDGATNGTSFSRSNALSEMFSNPNRAPLFVLLTILVAFALGALHAIEPGHGKALLAFTLVGSRATVKQAAILAASLTFAHTIGVLLLGCALFFAAGFVSESIYPWITLLSGAAVCIIGARNIARYLRGRHVHADGHAHAHPFTSDHHHGDSEHGHSHAIPGSAPIDFRGAIVAAMSGGIAPCPAAIVVMLAALRLHQLGYGLILIVIFSLGLASVLTALGIAVVHGSALVSRSARFERVVAAGPVLSALLISLVGASMVGQGFVAQGVHVSAPFIAGLTALAIGGYALTAHQHPHVHSVHEA